MTHTTRVEAGQSARRFYGYEELPRLLGMLTGDEKHSPSASSTIDVIWALYDRVLNIDPTRPDDPDRDRFLLSKGHGPMAYYAVLAAKGFIPVDTLPSYGTYESMLGMHPDGVLIPGVEIASGSLGHGLPIAVGMALALEAKHEERPRVVCLIGDGELDEGSNHEAIALAGRFGLGRLSAVVVDNGSASHGWPGGIESRFSVEGWTTAAVDGRDHAAIVSGFSARDADRPHAVVARVATGR